MMRDFRVPFDVRALLGDVPAGEGSPARLGAVRRGAVEPRAVHTSETLGSRFGAKGTG